MSIPQPCVVDANVLIDLYLSELLREFFRLPLDLLTPDVVVAELLQPDGKGVLAYGLRQAELSGQQVEEVAFLRAQYRRLSASDLSTFVFGQVIERDASDKRRTFAQVSTTGSGAGAWYAVAA